MKRIGLCMSKNRMKKANVFKIGDLVELIEDTYFYKKGTRAVVINNSSEGNTKKWRSGMKEKNISEEMLILF